MNRREFVDEFRIALAGQVNQNIIDENVRYYEDYISMEIKKGKSEEEVLNALGNPRLLAKTVIEANRSSGETVFSRETGSNENETFKRSQRIFKMPGWAFIVMLILMVVIIFGVITSVLSFLAPILIPVCIIMFVFSWIKRK